MSTDVLARARDKYVTVDGLKLRYIEEGEGPPVVLLHGASLGSSADVFRRNLPPLADAGFRGIVLEIQRPTLRPCALIGAVLAKAATGCEDWRAETWFAVAVVLAVGIVAPRGPDPSADRHCCHHSRPSRATA